MNQRRNTKKIKKIGRIRKKTILAFCIVMILQLFPAEGTAAAAAEKIENPKSELLRGLSIGTMGKQNGTKENKGKQNTRGLQGTATREDKFPKNLISQDKFVQNSKSEEKASEPEPQPEREVKNGRARDMIPDDNKLSPGMESVLVALILMIAFIMIVLLISINAKNCKIPSIITRRCSTLDAAPSEKTELTSTSNGAYQNLLTPDYNSVGVASSSSSGHRVTVTVEDHTQEPPVTVTTAPLNEFSERIYNPLLLLSEDEERQQIPLLFPVCPPRKKQKNLDVDTNVEKNSEN